MTYKTNTRSKIMEYLNDNKDRAVSIAEINEYLQKAKYIVDKTTIYRYINKLLEDGSVMRYVDSIKGMNTYQLKHDKSNCDEHLHLKCQKCGKVLHLDCDFMKDIKEHIKRDHGFDLRCHDSVIYGICQSCKAK